jgi:hypothetical protein
MFKEDSVQIPTQRSWIPSFHSDYLVLRPDAHQCLEDSWCSNVHMSGRHGNTSRCTLGFEKNYVFFHRHVYGKTTASVRTTGQRRPDEVFNKARCEEELQPSGRQGNTVWTRSLLRKLRAVELQSSKH